MNNSTEIAALELLKLATAKGWTVSVWGGDDEPDYKGKDPLHAWEAIEATDEAEVGFYNEQRQFMGYALFMVPHNCFCAPDETIVDSGRETSEFAAMLAEIDKRFNHD